MNDEDAYIQELISNKNTFNSFVYTPMEEALKELRNRWEDKDLELKLQSCISSEIPDVLKKEPKLVLYRQLFTPNYEFLRLTHILDSYDIKGVFWEFHDDKFTPNNQLKLHWGKIPVNNGIGKKGGVKTKYNTIIDFNKSNGKKIRQVKTLWGQSLIDFHHEILNIAHPSSKDHLFDASEWFYLNSGNVKDYYKNYTALFVRNGILLENFFLKGDDLRFTRDVFLPAFIEIYKKTGKKPLIVALEPTEIEEDLFWMSYPPFLVKSIKKRMRFIQYYKYFYYIKSLLKNL